MKLIATKAPLESVSIDILRELNSTLRGRMYGLSVQDRLIKLFKAILIKRVYEGKVAKILAHNWVLKYEPPTELIAHNGSQFKSKFFMDVCRILNIKNKKGFTTT